MKRIILLFLLLNLVLLNACGKEEKQGIDNAASIPIQERTGAAAESMQKPDASHQSEENGSGEASYTYEWNGTTFSVRIKSDEERNSEPIVAKSLMCWVDPRFTDMEKVGGTIVFGTVRRIQEFELSYYKPGQTDPTIGTQTKLTVDVEKVFYTAEENLPDTITVLYGLSRQNMPMDYEQELTDMKEGDGFYFFLERTAGNEKNLLGYENICDFFMVTPPTKRYFLKKDSLIDALMAEFLQLNADNKAVSVTVKAGDNIETVLNRIYGGN